MRKSVNIELLRVISIFMVILIHVYSKFMSMSLYNSQVIICISSFFKVSVPCFLMIMGYLYNPDKSVKKVWIKNIYRLIIPLFFFSIFYELFTEIFVSGKSLPEISTDFNLFINVFGSNVLGTSAFHLWYIYAILGIYLLYPVFSIVCKDDVKSQRVQRYLVIVGFILTIIIPTIRGLFPITSGFLEKLDYGFPYVVTYFLIGHYMKYLLPKIKINRYIFLLFYFFMITMSIICAKNFELASDKSYLFLTSFSYQSVFIAFAAIFFFMFVMKLKIKDNKFLFFIGDKTLIIYYVHLIFMNIIIYKFNLGGLKFDELIFYGITISIVTYIGSLLVALIFRGILLILKKVKGRCKIIN